MGSGDIPPFYSLFNQWIRHSYLNKNIFRRFSRFCSLLFQEESWPQVCLQEIDKLLYNIWNKRSQKQVNAELQSPSHKNLQKSSPPEGKIDHITERKRNKNTSLVAVKVVRQTFLVLPHLSETDFSVRDIYPVCRDEGSERVQLFQLCGR